MSTIDTLLATTKVLPVITLDEVDDALPLARALRDGGLTVLEVTLRTDAGLAAIEKIAADCPGVVVGAGSVLAPADMARVRDCGAAFAVSPGLTAWLLDAARASGVVYLPGAATPSELMLGMEYGYEWFKIFPALPLGEEHIKAIAAPFPKLKFVATGGIREADIQRVLALPNMRAVGVSFVVPAALLKAKDWAGITALAKRAVIAAG
jgi:2-dehydro-3-deoxyphosphogluconate aldolase / (4S)-4-hydroxy-2-oxoglutarate aldolase